MFKNCVVLILMISPMIEANPKLLINLFGSNEKKKQKAL